MRKAIAYYRESTPRQGESRLGIEAQEFVVRNFSQVNQIMLIGEYYEIESGGNDKRPVLDETIKECRKLGVELIIATQSRLGRDAGLVIYLIKSGIRFTAVDSPNDNDFIKKLRSVLDEERRLEIARDTKAALEAAKRRGVVLGKYGKEVLSKKNKQAADEFALRMKPIIDELRGKGFTTVRAITKQLKRRRIKTPSGKGKWHVKSVFNLLKRMNTIENDRQENPQTLYK